MRDVTKPFFFKTYAQKKKNLLRKMNTRIYSTS